MKCCTCVIEGNHNQQETRKSDQWGRDNLSVQGSPSMPDFREFNIHSGKESKGLIQDKTWVQ